MTMEGLDHADGGPVLEFYSKSGEPYRGLIAAFKRAGLIVFHRHEFNDEGIDGRLDR